MRYCLRAEPACPALGGPAGPRPPPGVKGAAGGEASLDTTRAAAVGALPHRGLVRPPLFGGPRPPAPARPLATATLDDPTPRGCATSCRPRRRNRERCQQRGVVAVRSPGSTRPPVRGRTAPSPRLAPDA